MKTTLFCSILMILGLLSCTERVDFPVPSEGSRRLVIDGLITDETKKHSVLLSFSSTYSNQEPATTVSNAQVTIFDGEHYHSLNETASGVYETDATVKGETGKSYTLDVALSSGERYEASSKMSAVGTIDSLWFESETIDEELEYQIFINGHGEASYYLFETYLNGIRLGSIVDVTVLDNSLLIDGNMVRTEVGSLIDEDLPDGENTLQVKMLSIDANYYEYVRSLQLQAQNGEFLGGLFDGPAANIPSNISNGGLGVFGASSVAEKRTKISNQL